MTKEELLSKLQELHDYNDPEDAHGQADDLLLIYINDNDIFHAYNKVPKNYE